jgi:hypothetical protein
MPCGPMLLIFSVHRDDSIFPGKNSCDLAHSGAKTPLREI